MLKLIIENYQTVKVFIMSTTKNKSTECSHHWSIEPPNGTMSIGNCKLCGEKREFRNSFEYSSWYGSKSPSDVAPSQTNTEKSE